MDFDEEFKESQRVSELAAHLLKTGTAASSAEAEKRAREMIYGKMESAAPAKRPEIGMTSAASGSDDYMKALEMSHNMIMKEVGAVKYKQDQMLSEIISLKSELSKIQIQQAAPVRQSFSAPAASAAEAKAEAPVKQDAAPAQPAAQPQAAAKPTNPSDISIEKYFYFGQKK